MSKNPFEIRAEMLQMAKDYLDRQWEMNCAFAQQVFDKTGTATEEMKAAMKIYSTEELMKKAQEFYGFVSKKD
jgi:hypothetical protein